MTGNIAFLDGGRTISVSRLQPMPVVLSSQGEAGQPPASGSVQSVQGAVGGTPIPVGFSGTAGVDYSANKPTLPNVGANFAAAGPYASYVLIATVPANSARFGIDIENTSGAQIVIVRDDGTAASASAPVNASVFVLAGGSGVGSQGGAWSSQTFKGRLQIYAPSSSAQVAVMGE